jgi:hypothetical protein
VQPVAGDLETYAPDEAPRRVLDLTALLVPQLLVGDDPQLKILRVQFEQARVSSVESSGVGFFVNYDVSEQLAAAVHSDFAGGDARITIAGLEAGAGCVLFVRGGHLALLETYTCWGERWPAEAEVLSVDGVFPLTVPEQ